MRNLVLALLMTFGGGAVVYADESDPFDAQPEPEAQPTETEPIAERSVQTAHEYARALREVFPHFLKTERQAFHHATAALDAEHHTGVPAARLLAIASIESNFRQQTISREECFRIKLLFVGDVCRRVAGRWLTDEHKPPHVRGNYFCGVLQIGGNISWARCWDIIRDVEGSYTAAAEHLLIWYDNRHCRTIRSEADRWKCTLFGYGGGKPLILAGMRLKVLPRTGPRSYPRRVRATEGRILAHLPKPES